MGLDAVIDRGRPSSGKLQTFSRNHCCAPARDAGCGRNAACGSETRRCRGAPGLSRRHSEEARALDRISLLKQLRREFVQVIAPVDPRVRTFSLLELHFEAMPLEHLD